MTIDMGLRHHLNDYVSQEEGDGRPIAAQLLKRLARSHRHRLVDPEKSMGWTVIGKVCALNVQPGELLSFDSEGE